jgi:hypothetical protein
MIMRNRFVMLVFSFLLIGCNFGTGPAVVYYPVSTKVTETTTVTLEDNSPNVIEEQVVEVETYVYTSCDPYFETLEAPFYHQPVTCTDYGFDVGYCCTWEYLDGYGECAHESCFWEDTCEWELVIDECVYDDYYDYY